MLVSTGVQRHDAGSPSGSAALPDDMGVSEVPRARILSAAVALVGEVGYARMTVARVLRLSGVSQETFYKCFEDLDECLLAAFEDAQGRIAATVVPAYRRERKWPAKVRAAVAALLTFAEREPAVSTFVFVGALGAGPKVLASRMQALERLKLAFEQGLDEVGMVAGSQVGESSPLSAEGAVNGVLGILHTRLLEGSPLARRPLSELAGPLTAMIVLPYIGHEAAARELTPRHFKLRPSSKVRPKVGARKTKRPRLNAQQRAILKTLEHGPLTVRELMDLTGLSDQTARNKLNGLLGREKVVKTELGDRVAYALPSKGGGSSTSNGTGALAATSASNGAGSPTSNGAGASNGHDRSAATKAMLRALDPQISEREFKVLAAIDELNAQGSSPSNREIGNATKIYDPTQLSKLIQRLAHIWLVQNNATGRKPSGWRLTTKGTELLRKLEGQTIGGTQPADARA
jgi:AcrR family transcriptional regulator